MKSRQAKENMPQFGFVHWVTHIRMSRLIGLLLVILIAVPLVAHYYISNTFDNNDFGFGSDGHRSRQIQNHEEISSARVTDLRFQIDDLKRIKASVNNELKELESRRQRLHAEISGYNTHIDELRSSYEKTRYELEQLKVTIENTRLEQEEIHRRNMPEVLAPKRVLPPLFRDGVASVKDGTSRQCRMHTCFDHSRCSLTSGFPVYLYDADRYRVTGVEVERFIRLSVTKAVTSSPHLTSDPTVACVFLVVVGDVSKAQYNSSSLGDRLRRLPYWGGDGHNHVLLNMGRHYDNRDLFNGINTGRAIIAQSSFTETQFRRGFDVVIPPSLGLSHGDVWDDLPLIVPARRRHLLSFQGEYWSPPQTNTASILQEQSHRKNAGPVKYSQDQVNRPGATPKHDNEAPSELEGQRSQNQIDDENRNPNVIPHFRNLLSVVEDPPISAVLSSSQLLLDLDLSIIETLKKLQINYLSDNFNVEFSCDKERVSGIFGEWCLCGLDSDRRDLLMQSTFSLIIAPTNMSIISTTLVQVRLYEALKYGAIPIILGDHTQLPFSELLQWQRAVITIPKSRITELHFLVRSFSDTDILEMRRQGRIFWETYFGTTQRLVNMVLAVLRTRLRIAALPVREEPTPSVFGSFLPLKDVIPDTPLQPDDILGPIEAPFPSLKFRRNFTTLDDPFNRPGDPFHAFPYTPYEPVMPGEAKFKGSGLGFRPIGKGEGGSGREFSEALGGNIPREQFTVVMLTYEREAVLIDAIARLKGLPHLNKVLVVWNNPQPPAEDLRWPEIGVEVVVARTSKNSLNNRFLPYDAIETEAILSIDDDAHLRNDEIIFGFRVWRENRDRIVGFPGRFHAWDLKDHSWMYNSNYSCELSMVLTGAAFFHKYYSYLYTYMMPQAIRDKVDEYLNCEDLAMNFLVSHITRKAPIKVTSRWTFRCPGCPNALSVDDSHFQERHRCMQYFVKVYGYMPLMYTQYRVDSVLFKTRIPHDKQKCFKFI